MINSITRQVLERFKVNKFIETGILKSHTPIIVSSWFGEFFGKDFILGLNKNCEIYEVDTDRQACLDCKVHTQNHPNIRVFNMSSDLFLRKTKEENFFDESDRLFFYLDAHASPEEFQTLRNELKELRDYKNIIISIDDWHLNDQFYDVYNITQIQDLVEDRAPVYFITGTPNIHRKCSAFIFFDKTEEELTEKLKGLDLIKKKMGER